MTAASVDRGTLIEIRPRGDGVEVLTGIKSDPRTRPIPVVMLTSSRDESALVRSDDPEASSIRPWSGVCQGWHTVTNRNPRAHTVPGAVEALTSLGETMFKAQVISAGALLLLLSTGAYAQSNAVATGNMHFDVKEMDTNGDHMITREEMMAYAEKTWDSMAQGKDTIPVEAAAKDFASGGVNFRARTIDKDHDGTISKAEFLAYAGRRFDNMKKTNNMVSVDDMARAIARGNTSADGGKAKASKDATK